MTARAAHRTAELTAEQRTAIRRATRELGRRAAVAPQLIQAVHALSGGRVILHIGNERSSPGRELDLFGADGEWLGTLEPRLPVNHRSELDSRGDTILFMAVGRLDAPVLTKAVIERDS